mgnify:CR=1 FL=1
MTSLFFPSISPEAGEPNNEVIPSKEFKYQLKSQILSEIKNEINEETFTYFYRSLIDLQCQVEQNEAMIFIAS